jgi:hypothetical protein
VYEGYTEYRSRKIEARSNFETASRRPAHRAHALSAVALAGKPFSFLQHLLPWCCLNVKRWQCLAWHEKRGDAVLVNIDSGKCWLVLFLYPASDKEPS